MRRTTSVSAYIRRLLAARSTTITAQDMIFSLADFRNRLEDDAENHSYFLIRRKEYYLNDHLFALGVFNNFPSANDDIFEAGTCLALERATACVMHLMRALEVALAALAKAVDVTNQNDWGAYLRKIEMELDARAKAAGARSIDEQFYAEAAANFDRLRRAFRNPTMHPDKSYSPERAEEILVATRSFMTHLATRLSE